VCCQQGRNQALKAARGEAAGPRVIFSLPEAGVQVVARGVGGRGRFFRGRGARLELSLRNFPLPSVSDGGLGDWSVPDRRCSSDNMCTLVFVCTLLTHRTW
jgi:hypothetical protein